MATGNVRAAGYVMVFGPPLLMLVGQLVNAPWLLALLLFTVGPMLRAVIGNIPEEVPEISERVATALDLLPATYAAVTPLVLAAVLMLLERQPPTSTLGWLAFGLSLWVFMLCMIPVAHELSHRRGAQRRLGAMLAGIAGYPALEGEHLMHHGVSGVVDPPEWPSVKESVWSYMRRRLPHVYRQAARYDLVERAKGRRRCGSLLESGAALLATATAFGAVGGVGGLLTYVLASFGIHIAVQVINFMQHWGLGVDNVDGADHRRFAWECRCQLQGWVFLNIALHYAHHQKSGVPYFLLAPHPLSPRLPASYAVLLFVVVVPSLWRKLMTPALEAWKAEPRRRQEPARGRILCLPIGASRESTR